MCIRDRLHSILAYFALFKSLTLDHFWESIRMEKIIEKKNANKEIFDDYGVFCLYLRTIIVPTHTKCKEICTVSNSNKFNVYGLLFRVIILKL